ncbi:hypothetical protein JTB14_028026 [Gonioctena quinquepunctata]|nr:hypothetical protein JTB14_028026 [Gonioctena quinquepunctata]
MHCPGEKAYFYSLSAAKFPSNRRQIDPKFCIKYASVTLFPRYLIFAERPFLASNHKEHSTVLAVPWPVGFSDGYEVKLYGPPSPLENSTSLQMSGIQESERLAGKAMQTAGDTKRSDHNQETVILVQ